MSAEINGGQGSISVREFLFGNQTEVIPSENIVESPYAGVICVKSEVVLKPIISEITYGLIGGLLALFVLFAITLLYGICITRKLNQINASLSGEAEAGKQPRTVRKGTRRVFGLPGKSLGPRSASLRSIKSLPENQAAFNTFNVDEAAPNGTFALANAPPLPAVQNPTSAFITPVYRGNGTSYAPNSMLYPRLGGMIPVHQKVSCNPSTAPGGSPYCVTADELHGRGCNVTVGSVENIMDFVCTRHDPEHGCSGVFPDEG